MTMSANDKQVILAEVQAARAENRPVNQQRIRALLPHLSQSTVNSRVARLRNALNNPRPTRPRRSATTAAPLPAYIITPTGTIRVQATTPLATADRALDEVQVAIELARFGGSRPDSSAGINPSDQVQQQLTTTQGEVVDVCNQVQAAQTDVASVEETIRMQDEDILSSQAERLQLKSTFNEMERELQTVRSQLQVIQAEIASKNEAIKKLNQDVQSLRRPIDPSNEILFKRRLEIALKENASKDEAIERLKHDMKVAKDGFSARLHHAQQNITDRVTRNFREEVQDLKDKLHDSCQQYEQDVSRYQAHIAKLEQDLCYAKWVTNVHKYLASVEEDLQALADRLSRFLTPQDRSSLYSKRDLNDISTLPTLRWASRVYGLYYGMAPEVIEDMESSLNKWRVDRNYFAHHSKTDDLTRRGMVLDNALEMHGALTKLLEDLDRVNDTELHSLANDAFNDLSSSIRMH